MLRKLRNSIVNLEEQRLLGLLKTYLDQGVNPGEILRELRGGLEDIGEKFEKGEYFLSELVMAGEIMKGAMNLLTPSQRRHKRSRR